MRDLVNYSRLNEREIRNYIGDARINHRGRMYYFNRFVEDVVFNQTRGYISAVVRGTRLYTVKLFVNSNSDIYAVNCTCQYYRQMEKPCKHISAVLYELMRVVDNQTISYKNSHIPINAIFNRMDSEKTNLLEGHKDQIHLYPTLHVSKENSTINAFLEFKTGVSRSYVVKSVEEFLDAWFNGKKLRFGNQLTLDSGRQYYSGIDKQIMDILTDIYVTNLELLNFDKGSYRGLIRGRNIILTSSNLEKYLDIMTGNNITAAMFHNDVNTIPVVEEELPVTFEIRDMDDWMSVRFSEESIPEHLIPNSPFYYLNGKIYKALEPQSKYLSIVNEGFKQAGAHEFTVASDYQDRFVSEVVPIMKKTGIVFVSPSLKEQIVQETLKAEIYLDQYKNGICAKVVFIYGKYKINPASGHSTLASDSGFILRDIEKEQPVINILKEGGFYIEDDQYCLMDKEKIYLFVFEKLQGLQTVADVYYSEDFNKVTVKRSIHITGRVSLVDDMLEVTFNTENIDLDELKGILQSLRRKKKFYRLQDGGILPLEQHPDLDALLNIADQLDISPSDMDDGKFYIPKYRAFYIDEYFDETNDGIIEKTREFEQYVESISQVKNQVYKLPQSLENIMRDYQKVGFQWFKALTKSGLGGILADDMGLGKTLQVLALVLSEKEERNQPALVIAPTSLVYNWVSEAEKFTPELKVLAIVGDQTQRQPLLEQINEYDLVITSYPLIRRDISAYKQYRFSFCFIDEAQHVKNHYTQSARAIRKISAKNRFALTGTPMENSLMELWSIFDFIMPGYLYSQQVFQERFEKPIVNEASKEANSDLSRHIRPFILRRMKKDVLKELPEKIESTITCGLTEEQRKLYNAILAQARHEIEENIEQRGFERSHIQILAALTRLRQICCHPASFIEDYQGGSGKLELLDELLDELLSSGHRVLLFSQFTSVLDIIEKELINKGIKYFYLSGKTPAIERASIVSRFNEGESDVFLLSLKAGGTGLTLTGADTIIHYDPWWNPAVEEQATDRAYRIGQDKVVQVFKLITRKTIEEKIIQLQKKKKEMIDMVIKPGETMIQRLTSQEIRNLFEE